MDATLERFTGERRALVARLFPDGVPTLWCPPLTHFDDRGAIDRPRMRAHLRFLQPYVRGFLVPGSTGEGWDLSEAERRELVDFMAAEIEALGGHLLIGALKPTASEMVRAIEGELSTLARRTGAREPIDSLVRSAVRGFAVCPPRGASRSQQEMTDALEQVLALGVPIALYQLPQVTENEIAPQTVAALAARHPQLYLLKDSSGGDRVAASGLRDLFLVRGADNDYLRHLAAGGGRYDGFLLSTANCFPRQLSAMIAHARGGDLAAAEAFSRALTLLITELLDRAGRVGFGNPFANANKALDHFFAHGPDAADVLPPRVHGGRRLPRELIDAAGAALRRHGLLPERGYLAVA